MSGNRLFIFDFDGTLCATHEAITYCMQQTFAEFQAPIPDAVAVQRTISAGVTLDDTIRMLNPNLSGREPAAVAEWVEAYRRIYNGGDGQSRTFLFDGVLEVFERLSADGVRTAVVSNKGIVAIRTALERFGLTPHVSVVVGDTPGVRKKPHPDAFAKLIQPSFPELAADQVAVVGDTTADILFARNVGARACWASYGYGIPEECMNLRPDVVVDHPRGILDFVHRTID